MWSLNAVSRAQPPPRGRSARARAATPCAWCVVQTAGGVLGDHAGGRRHGVADERVVAPPLLPPTVQPDPAAGVPGAVGAGVPERVVVAPRGEADRLQVRPRVRRRRRSRGRSRSTLPASRPWSLAYPSTDDGVAAVGREREALDLPRRARRGCRAVRAVRSSRATTPWYQPEPEWSLETTATTVLVAVPVDLPDAQVRRADLVGAGRSPRSTRKSRRRASPGRRTIGSGARLRRR